jgi:hypothetical protein
MPNQTIPLQLPDAIYQRLQQVPHATHHSIEEVLLQTIRGNLPLVIEPIMPLVGGGSSTPDNLCLACYRCNEFKGSRAEAADPIHGELTLFFHPRRQRWSEHFAWHVHGDTMNGLTSCGRTTIEALHLNNDWIVQARRLWMLVGLYPLREAQWKWG